MKTERVNLPPELYKAWLEEETNKVANLSATEIEGRILELEKMIFESKTRLSIAHQKRITLMGKDWADNSRAISSPDFRVNYEKDQREKKPVVKKTKEEKAATLNDAAGIDTNKLKELIKAKMLERAKKPMVTPVVKPAPGKPIEVVKSTPVVVTTVEDDEDDD